MTMNLDTITHFFSLFNKKDNADETTHLQKPEQSFCLNEAVNIMSQVFLIEKFKYHEGISPFLGGKTFKHHVLNILNAMFISPPKMY